MQLSTIVVLGDIEVGSSFNYPDKRKRAHPDLNQGPADLQSAALTTELCTQMIGLEGKAHWHGIAMK